MTDPAFVLATIALLIAPGPTNMLLALAGAEGGRRRAFNLIPLVLLAYLAVILPLVWIGQEVLTHWPRLEAGVKLAAAGWVLFLALRLWRAGGQDGQRGVTAPALFMTTLLNPKALVFGLVLLPGLGQPGFAMRLVVFLALLTGASLLWGLGGTLAGRGAALRLVQRIGAGGLAVVAVMLLGAVVGG